MELVYPIYLDTPMMTAFLASMKGGLVEITDVETKSGTAKNKAGKGSFGAKVSNLISAFVDANAQIEGSISATNNSEQQLKGTVKFPEASLFIELRRLLTDEKVLKNIKNTGDFATIAAGDIVEFNGLAKPSPSYELRTAMNQLFPLVTPFLNMQKNQLKNQLAGFEQFRTKGQKGDVVKIGEKEISYREVAKNIQTQINALEQQVATNEELAKIMEVLLPHETSTSIIIESAHFRSICRVFSEYARNGDIQQMFAAEWRCVGKVIGVLDQGDEVNLFSGLPIGLFARTTFNQMIDGLQNDELNIAISDPVVKGRALILAVLAIFT